MSSRHLAQAVERGDAGEVARWIAQRDFTLVETPEDSDGEGKAALIADVDDCPMLVAFTSESQAALFARAMPELLDADGKLPAFVVYGQSFLANLPEGCGVLLDPETDDCVVIPPDLIDAVRAAGDGTRSVPATLTGQPDLPLKPLATVQIEIPDRRLTPLQEQVFDWLESRGFRPARWLPAPDTDRELRPAEEIASRLMALSAVFSWVSAPKEAVPAERLSKYIQQNHLRRWLTDEEAAILTQPRAKAREAHLDGIGWKLENMWPLAWILGYEAEPTIEASQINTAVSRPMMFEFLPGLDGTVAQLLEKSRVRPAEQVIALEYRFYCAHNAVRGAQLGEEDRVPEGFHPITHGGAVHERRHALTWSLSPGTAWDDTDLST
jgi:hypothetical protein